MAQLFARVELRGSPSAEIYEKLHSLMKKRNWSQTIKGKATVNLPHAVYQATSTSESPDVVAIADGVKAAIESDVWTKAIVLIIVSTNWALTAG